MQLSGIIDYTNSNSLYATHWMLFLWISTSAKLLSPAVNSTFSFLLAFLMNFMTLLDNFNIFIQFLL